ncbi:MAG: methionyl-tRNA formyltransferase [Erythrobacter sp.]|nr:methionyl-tRNA formyltransferase [Erythrobacter sp.]
MGTPDFAVPALVALHDAKYEIACVYTQPPRPAGRGKKLRPSPVHVRAEELGLEVRTPKSLRNAEAQADFAALRADVAVVAAYGLILPQEILDAPGFGCVNIHASLLPRWRGAAPIHRAIMAGDEETGVTIMQMEAGLDTGPMLYGETTPISDKTTGELTEELARLGADALIYTLADLGRWQTVASSQDDELATYAPKIDKAEARIDWSQPAKNVVRHIHGLSPFPGAWFELEGERVKLLRALALEGDGEPGMALDDQLTIACGSGAIRPLRLQRAGKPAMDLADFLRGNPVAAGTKLA